MPNKYQLAFVLSCALSTASLIFAFRAINHSLLAAGFDFADIILLGLPKDKDHPEMGNHDLQEMLRNLDFKELAASPAVLVSAGLIIATLVFTALYSSSGIFVL